MMLPLDYGECPCPSYAGASLQAPAISTKEIEAYINEGGAVGEAQKAIGRGNKMASLAVTGASTVAHAGMAAGAAATAGTTLTTATGTSAVTVATAGGLTSISTALGKAGIAAANVPVVGWVIAGVLVVAAGGLALGARRRARILSKDRRFFEKLVRRYERRSQSWRDRKARKEIATLKFRLSKGSRWGWQKKQQARSEMDLEALFLIYKNENFDRIQQEAQVARMNQVLAEQQTNLQYYAPLYLGLLTIGIVGFAYGIRKRRTA